ncbi:MAG: hypothetical protein IKY18_00275 [Oscillospiraceae bacterium]|nr:hypothetical protein [Oscillospiraceae bacterium]
MKKFFQEKPWYFATAVLGFILQPILEWFVMYFFDEEAVKAWLAKSVLISDIIPWVLCAIIFFVCTIVYVVQQSKANSKIVSSDELNVLNKTLLTVVDENEHIESMQAFQHRVKNDDGRKYIKLSYLAGAANERIEINTILQTYFYFSYPIHKKIRNVSSRYNKYLCETDPIQKEEYWTDFADAGNELCNQLKDSLDALNSVSEIEERHCDMYRVLAKLLPTIAGVAIESFLQKSDVEEALVKRKKTGILGALVINDLYIFRNRTSVTKGNRIYFAFPYSIEKDIVFLGSIDGGYFDEMSAVEAYCKSIVSKVCSSHTA